MYGSLILNIVFTGASYALVSVPFALILGIMHMINFAHGEFITIGAFATYVFVLLFGFDYTLAVPAAGVSAAILGLICERVIFRHLRGKFFALLCATLGLSYLLQGSSLSIFGLSQKSVLSGITGAIEFLGVRYSLERLTLASVGLVVVVATYIFIEKTRFGIALAATGMDPEAASLQGMNTDRIYLWAFTIGCGLAGVGGALIAPIFVIEPFMGLEPLGKAFIIVVLGGLGSIKGAIVAAFIIGLIEAVGLTFIGQSINAYMFGIFIIILIFRPRGLFGHA
jgi:branched-chain amino acid transport system permease protein